MSLQSFLDFSAPGLSDYESHQCGLAPVCLDEVLIAECTEVYRELSFKVNFEGGL